MRIIQAAAPCQFLITNDYDVILMRQEVRQLARDLGLGLARQAKLAVAIGMIARMLIAVNHGTTIRIWTSDPIAGLVLEIACSIASRPLAEDLAQLERELRFDEIRMLVDEATVSLDANETLLNLRIRLNNQG
ncbi:MAG: hypothetical protein ACJ8CR_28135 [Roseiflexaceae bacterium]